MAAVTVTNDSQRMHDMGDTDGTTGISNLGGGGAVAAEPDFFYQGSNSVSRKVSTSLIGHQIDTSAFGTPRSADMTAADRPIWLCKIQATNKDALQSLGAPALEVRIGSSSTDYYELQIAGNETEFYPKKGGWLLLAIDPNLAANQSNATGSPSLTGVDLFAWRADFTATSKSENAMMDAIDVGLGLNLVGGDGGSTDGVFDDFINDDQGDQTNGSFGFFFEQNNIVEVLGMHWIGRDDTGSTTATEFTDSSRVLVFPDSLHGPGDQGFSIDLGSASTIVDWTSCTFLGIGHGNRRRFDTETEVDGTGEEVTNASVIAAFRPMDAVIVRSQGGGETPGITNGTRYWVGKDLTATPTGITFHTSRNDAAVQSGSGGGTPVNLTASSAGNGEIWRIDKDNDTRPELQITGTSGTFDATLCTFTNFGTLVATSGATFTSCTITTSGTMTQGGATVDTCSIADHTTVEAEAFMTASAPASVSDTAFDNTGGRGHGMRLTNSGTVGFIGNTFAGYGGSTTVTDHQFDNTSGVSSNQITMDSGDVFVTGEAVVYSKVLTANTVVTGLTDQTTYYVRRISAGVYSLYNNEGDAVNNNNIISLTAGSGNETHALWSANAAIWNDSGGAVTLNVSGGGSTPTVRNSLNSTTTVVSSVTVTVTVLDEATSPIQNAQTAIYRNSDGLQIMNQDTNASGVASTSFGGSVPVSVSVRVRKNSPGDTRYFPVNSSQVISASGLDVTITLIEDTIVM